MVDFAMLRYYCLRCCSTYFFNLAIHNFLILQYIIFDVAVHSFAMLQYLYSDVALHSLHIFAILYLKCFVFLGQGSGGEQGA